MPGLSLKIGPDGEPVPFFDGERLQRVQSAKIRMSGGTVTTVTVALHPTEDIEAEVSLSDTTVYWDNGYSPMKLRDALKLQTVQEAAGDCDIDFTKPLRIRVTNDGSLVHLSVGDVMLGGFRAMEWEASGAPHTFKTCSLYCAGEHSIWLYQKGGSEDSPNG